MSWCTIESDPAVFTEMLEAFGAKGVELQELWSMDEEVVAQLPHVYGLFFLFKWDKTKGVTRPAADASSASHSDDVFFCQQTINNACGTIALLHVLLNNEEIEIGDTLAGFKSFALDLPADMRGQALGELKTRLFAQLLSIN